MTDSTSPFPAETIGSQVRALRLPAVAKSRIVWTDGKFLLISEGFAVSIRTSETAAALKISLTTLGVSFRPNLVPIGTVEKIAAAPSV